MMGTLRQHFHASDVFLQTVIELLETESACKVASPERIGMIIIFIMIIMIIRTIMIIIFITIFQNIIYKKEFHILITAKSFTRS